MQGTFSSAVSCSHNRRVSTSVAPPVAKGTTNLIGLLASPARRRETGEQRGDGEETFHGREARKR